MRIDSLEQNTNSSRCLVISTVFLLLLFIGPVSAFAQDPDSIAALRQIGKAFATIAEKASPAVVGLKAERTVTREYSTFRDWPFGDPFQDDLFDFFRRRSPRQRSPQRREQTTVQGSGFIISSDGYILTNNHMVDEAKKVSVELADGRKFTAEVTGTDPDSDVAVVKIDANELPYLELADSDAIEVGEWVLAIGNPLGLSHTVTAGIVSAKGRSGFGLATIENFIQTDAAINRGNSGGPLINLDGKVVGINTAIVGATGNIGIGFAIPIDMAKHAYKQLREGGAVVRGYLGIWFRDLDPEYAAALDLKEDAKGVVITDVIEESAAEKAGLKRYDVVVEFEGQPIEKSNEFLNRVAMLNPGTKVEVVVQRDGKRKTFTVKLGKRPPEEVLAGTLPAETVEELGFAVENLTEALAERYGYEGENGVIVSQVDPGSQAAQVGIVPGVLIREVNRQEVKNTKEFNEAIKKAKKKGSALLLVRRGHSAILALITFSEEK
ncbi:MAG: DegQ family serine endoprotease [Planctomycetota bacterium]|jgi:serine protease Do